MSSSNSSAVNVSRRATLRGIGGLSAALLLATTPRLAEAASTHPTAQTGATAALPSVAGAWDLVFRTSDGASSADRIIATFGAEGGFQAALTPGWRTSAGTLRFHGGGHGTWKAGAGGVIEAGYTALTYDETGSCDGSRQVGIRASFDGSKGLTGTYVSRIYDADGILIDFATGPVDGVIAGLSAANNGDSL